VSGTSGSVIGADDTGSGTTAESDRAPTAHQ
jgi:hypothetical protein